MLGYRTHITYGTPTHRGCGATTVDGVPAAEVSRPCCSSSRSLASRCSLFSASCWALRMAASRPGPAPRNTPGSDSDSGDPRSPHSATRPSLTQRGPATRGLVSIPGPLPVGAGRRTAGPLTRCRRPASGFGRQGAGRSVRLEAGHAARADDGVVHDPGRQVQPIAFGQVDAFAIAPAARTRSSPRRTTSTLS